MHPVNALEVHGWATVQTLQSSTPQAAPRMQPTSLPEASFLRMSILVQSGCLASLNLANRCKCLLLMHDRLGLKQALQKNGMHAEWLSMWRQDRVSALEQTEHVLQCCISDAQLCT